MAETASGSDRVCKYASLSLSCTRELGSSSSFFFQALVKHSLAPSRSSRAKASSPRSYHWAPEI